MRSPTAIVLSVLTGTAVALSLVQPSSAASAVSPPWVTASSTTSLTLDWPSKAGAGSYRVFYATTYGGVLSRSARSKTTGSSKITIGGLRPGTMYCFQTGRRSGADRSPRYCHPTMKRRNNPSATKVAVATFNVCGHAAACKSWSAREDAIVSRIKAADVDVVNVQEAYGRINRLDKRLRSHGFVLAAGYGTEAVFYKPSKLRAVTKPRTENRCEEVTITYAGDTSSWDTALGEHFDGTTWWYWQSVSQAWTRVETSCKDVTVQVPVNGTFALGGNATAAWAQLALKKTQKKYVFVSAHLTSGKTAKNDRSRDAETRRLITKAEKAAGSSRVVYAGDFNSNRSRPNDAPRKRFARSGITDAYDRSSSYARAYLNSFNGWKTKPNRGVRYGDHVDHVFVKSTFGVSSWAVVAKMRGSRYATPIASDHNLVRATIWLS